ncbi:DUF4747 family protein [Sessilibacter sp. MAH1]
MQYKAIPGHSIEPDKDLRTLANIAAKFGNVHAKGKDALSKPIEYTTSSHPWKDKFYYDPAVERAFDMLVVKVLSVKDEIASWFK